MLKIGDFSKLTRVSIRMLRYYDEIGLLRPVHTDGESGYRYYSEDQLPVACRIRALKDMGFSLSAVRALLECYDKPEALERLLIAQRDELAHLAEETAYRMRLLDTAISRLRKGEQMNFDVTVKTIPERRAACVRMTIPCYEQEGMLWGVLMEETAPLRPTPDDPCLCCVVFHDGEWKEADVDLEVQMTVRGDYPDTAHVAFKALPAVQVASVTYKGSYEQIGEVYSAIYAWIMANGYAPGGPMMNIYHVGPHETQNPDEFVTEVCCPVKRA